VRDAVSCLILGSVASMVLAAAPAWAELKIGYVNYNPLLQDLPDAKASPKSRAASSCCASATVLRSFDACRRTS
jgi:Skp family chaperone for outer membrane proteins